jgi:hypothetical protein
MPNFNCSPQFVAFSLEPNRYENVNRSSIGWGDNIADAEVVRIWELYRSQSTSIPPFELITQLTKRVAQLIGNLENWLKVNFQKNPLIAESTLDFITDTVNFTNGGNRKYCVSTWYDLVNVKNEGESWSDKKHMLNHIYIPTTEEFLSNWLSRDGGVDDFFVTAQILFGNL